MEYRKLPHGEEKISVIGMGSSVVGEQKEEDIIKTVEYALDAGINLLGAVIAVNAVRLKWDNRSGWRT